MAVAVISVMTWGFESLPHCPGSHVGLSRIIRCALERAEAPSDLVRDLTHDIAFGITALIDGVSGFNVNTENVSPVLTFSTRENELEFAGGNSWMHEYVAKLIAESFSENKQ